MKDDEINGGASDARSFHSFVEVLKISESYCNNTYSVVVGLYEHPREGMGSRGPWCYCLVHRFLCGDLVRGIYIYEYNSFNS